MATSEWYFVPDLAKKFGKHPKTIQRLCRQGVFIGAQKIGREWRVPRQFVDIEMVHFVDELVQKFGLTPGKPLPPDLEYEDRIKELEKWKNLIEGKENKVE